MSGDVDDGPRPRRRARAAAAAFGLLAAFVVVEAGLRVLHAAKGTYDVSADAAEARRESPWMASADAELVYVHRPGFRDGATIEIESHGILRPADARPERAAGTVRVAVVGDSVGAALTVPHGERFASRLERRLGETGRGPTEVLNFCIDGYDTLQEARLLETSVGRFAPDAVVVAFCLNDPAESVVPVAWFREPDPPLSYAADFADRIVRRIAGRPRGRVLAPAAGPDDTDVRPHWDRAWDEDGPGWAQVVHGLDRIAAWSRERRVPVLVAGFPLLLDGDREGRTTAAWRERLADAVRSRGLEWTDLQGLLAENPADALRVHPGDVYHLGTFGHGLAAGRLVEPVRRMLAR